MTEPTTVTLAGPTSRPEPRRFAGHDGLSLAYDDFGVPDGDPIVFLHGGTDSRVTWDLVIPAVCDRYRVLLPDARGQGDSDRDPNGYDAVDSFAADVITLCEEVLDRPAVFVGASHGGVIAPAVAARRPDVARGLFLLDPPLFGPVPAEIGGVFEALEGLVTAVDSSDDRHAAVRGLLETAPALSGEGTMLDVLGEDGVDRLAFSWSHVDPAFVETARQLVAEDDPFAPDGPIGCPVLVVCADPDAWGCCFRADHRDRLREVAPQAGFVTASGLGHMLHNEQPALVASHLSMFLSSL